MARVVGSRYGIVRRCIEFPGGDGLPRIHTWVAQGPRRIPGWSFRDPPDGTGVSADTDLARLASVAEAVERYSSMAPLDPALVVRASFAELGASAVAPRAFARMSSVQHARFPKVKPFTDDKVVDWCWAFSLTRGVPVRVPAALVYFSSGGSPPNDFSAEMVSSGFACHVSLPHAALTGLCEVLERDALSVAWHNRLPLTPLLADASVEELAAEALGGCGVRLSLFRVPTDSPFPVVLALARSDERTPHAVVGIACRSDPIAAAVKALCEVCQILPRFRVRPPTPPARLRELADHASFYATAEGARLLDRHLVVAAGAAHPLESLATVGVGSAPHDLAAGVAALERVGLEVLVVEVTTPDVAQAGFCVLRVLVPGTLDMCADPRFPQLGTPRLYELPVRLGLHRRPVPESRLNRLPIPLA